MVKPGAGQSALPLRLTCIAHLDRSHALSAQALSPHTSSSHASSGPAQEPVCKELASCGSRMGPVARGGLDPLMSRIGALLGEARSHSWRHGSSLSLQYQG